MKIIASPLWIAAKLIDQDAAINKAHNGIHLTFSSRQEYRRWRLEQKDAAMKRRHFMPKRSLN